MPAPLALRARVARFLDAHNAQAVVLQLAAPPASALAAAAAALARAGLRAAVAPPARCSHAQQLEAAARLAAAPSATLFVRDDVEEGEGAFPFEFPLVLLGDTLSGGGKGVSGGNDGGGGGSGGGGGGGITIPEGGDKGGGSSVLRLPGCSLEAFVDAAIFEGAPLGGSSGAAVAAAGELGFGPHRIAASQVFFETALSVALVNIKPVLPGHVLVISRRRCRRFTELRAEEVADLWLTAQRVGAALERHLGGSALTLAIQDGADAGQSVAHVHVHVLPRRRADLPNNDELYKIIDRTGVAPEVARGAGGTTTGAGIALDPLGKGGAAAASASAPALRSAEEMAREADRFRALFV